MFFHPFMWNIKSEYFNLHSEIHLLQTQHLSIFWPSWSYFQWNTGWEFQNFNIIPIYLAPPIKGEQDTNLTWKLDVGVRQNTACKTYPITEYNVLSL